MKGAEEGVDGAKARKTWESKGLLVHRQYSAS